MAEVTEAIGVDAHKFTSEIMNDPLNIKIAKHLTLFQRSRPFPEKTWLNNVVRNVTVAKRSREHHFYHTFKLSLRFVT